MDYSLQNLNKIAKLKNLTFNNFVEKLNLIGLEVDNICYEKMITNNFIDNIQLLLKIPANREDLLNEKFFLKELSTIFLFEIFELWENLKTTYSFLLEEKNHQYFTYSKILISSDKPNILSYLIEIQNYKILPSPIWLSNKLITLNIKPKNNITDILALVFSEWGQNINLFHSGSTTSTDFSDDFYFQYLTNSESYIDPTNNSFLLVPGTVVLKNKKTNSIISVLGIINATFNENTTLPSFFLEGSFYDIHKNPLLLNTLNTKISLKYLRRACLENFKYSLQRILTLLEIVTGATINSRIYSTKDFLSSGEKTKIVRLKKSTLFNFLKIEFPDLIIFKKAGLELISETNNEYCFKIPTYRHDLVREIDLIEEYSRFVGYKNFKEISPIKQVKYTKTLFRQIQFTKNFFLNYGFNELLNNPISDFENKNEFSIYINNPLNSELSVLRRSLISKILNVFELNSRSLDTQTNFFEFGRTFKLINHKIIEQDKLAGVFQVSINKSSKKDSSEWFIAKGFLETFIANFGYKNIVIKKVKEDISYFHPTRSILFVSNNKILGIFGELHPLLVKEKYSHVRGTIYFFEFNLNYFRDWQLNSQINLFKEYSKYPLIVKDLSILIDRKVDFNFLKQFIISQSIYLKKVKFFDIYFDEKVLDKVNIGIRLEFQSNIETLTNEIIELQIEKIKIAIISNFNIIIRI